MRRVKRRRKPAKGLVRCFCAFCRTERRIYMKKSLSIFDSTLCLLVSLLAMWIVWQQFDPRFFVIFAFVWGVSELFVLIRWRVALPCRACGFDPLVYKRNPSQAAERVKAHLKRRAEDPSLILAPIPKLPVIRKKVGHTPGAQSKGKSTRSIRI